MIQGVIKKSDNPIVWSEWIWVKNAYFNLAGINASMSPPQFEDSSAALLITPGPKSTKYALSFTITA